MQRAPSPFALILHLIATACSSESQLARQYLELNQTVTFQSFDNPQAGGLAL